MNNCECVKTEQTVLTVSQPQEKSFLPDKVALLLKSKFNEAKACNLTEDAFLKSIEEGIVMLTVTEGALFLKKLFSK